jgi:outer membrane protein assembly factor BamB
MTTTTLARARRSTPCRLLVAIAVVTVAGLATPSSAQDWPQWRGPNRDAAWAEANVPETFPPGGPAVRWRAPVGFGWSSPVVSGGRVFVTDANVVRPTPQERVHCFDELTGKPLWTHAHDVTYPDWAFVAGQEPRPTATPLAEAGRLYTLDGNGHIYCLDVATGQPVWERRLQDQYKIETLKIRASPLVEGRLLILLVGGRPGACVVALDKDTGAEVWHALDDAVSNSSPVVVTAGGKRQLIVWTCDSVASLDPATGQTYWREPLVTSNNDAVSTPVTDGSLLLVSGLMFRLDPDKPAATVIWPESRGVARRVLSHTSTPLLRGGHVYGSRSSGELVCLDAGTGKVVWETDEVTEPKSGASIHLTPLGAGGAALLFTDQGELIRALLAPVGYKETARARLLDPTYRFSASMMAWSPPAFANGHVFARNDKELVSAALLPGQR